MALHGLVYSMTMKPYLEPSLCQTIIIVSSNYTLVASCIKTSWSGVHWYWLILATLKQDLSASKKSVTLYLRMAFNILHSSISIMVVFCIWIKLSGGENHCSYYWKSIFVCFSVKAAMHASWSSMNFWLFNSHSRAWGRYTQYKWHAIASY